MELLDNPMPFAEAVKHLLAKKAMPTGLDSAGLRGLGGAVMRQSLASARTTDEYYLDQIGEAVESVINPKTEQRADRVTPENPQGNVTTGFNPATARASLRDIIQQSGYAPSPEDKGTIKDLSSDARINLVVKTNVQLAQGAGHFVQGNASQDAVEAFPAWELVRIEDKLVPRGEKLAAGALVPDPENSWPARFRAAAEESGDDDALRVLEATGRMIALKASPLWESLGNGAGGYEDTLQNPYPPFAFNSGMWVEEVSYQECVDVDLIDDGDKVGPAAFDFAGLFKAADDLGVTHIFNSNYDPDQARDSLGKWVDENGGGLSEKDNIQRGQKAIDRALRQKRDVPRAMYRKEVGQIDFKWGTPGRKAADGKGVTRTEGGGISHMQAKHPEDLNRLPEVLAKGRIIPHDREEDKRYVIHGDSIAVLRKVGKRKAWAVTHFEDPNKIQQLEQKRRPN